MAHFVLKTVGPVERAPIMSSLPARDGAQTHMLDLGANSKATAIQLAQFATMGSIVARDVFDIANRDIRFRRGRSQWYVGRIHRSKLPDRIRLMAFSR